MILSDIVLRKKGPNKAPQEEGKGWGFFRGGGPRYLSTRTTRTYVLFEWAHLNDTTSFLVGISCVFIFSVVATIIIQFLQQFEKEVTNRIAMSKWNKNIKKCSPLLIGGAAFSYTIRMALCYLLVLALVDMNFWVLLSVLFGHFVGWVLYSGTIIDTQQHHHHHQQQQQQHLQQRNKKGKSSTKHLDSCDGGKSFDSHSTDSDGESV